MHETKGAITRQRVIENAGQIIHTRGYANTSITDIIKATGVKKGNLYFYFSSKEDLLYEIIKNARKNYNKRMFNAIKGDTAVEKLKNLTMSVYKYHKSIGFTGGCIFGNTALEMADNNKGFAGLINEIFNEWKDTYANIIKEGIDSGELKKDIDPVNLARHIISTLEGGVMLSRVSKNGNDLLQTIKSLHQYLEMLSC